MLNLNHIISRLKASEVIRYILIGGLTQLVDLGCFSIFVLLGIPHLTANLLAIPFVVSFNYFGQKFITFRVKQYSRRELLKYGLNLIFLAAYSSILLYLFIDVGQLPELVGKILQVLVITISNFFILKRLVFTKPK